MGKVRHLPRSGGLVSGASKVVAQAFRRRAKARLCAMTLETACSIGFLLLADVLEDLLQFEPDGRDCIPTGQARLLVRSRIFSG
jgi:hypothetical protein